MCAFLCNALTVLAKNSAFLILSTCRLIVYDTPRTLHTSWGTQVIDYSSVKLDTTMLHKLRTQGFKMLM